MNEEWIRDAARTIADSWDEWYADAQQQAQQEQLPEAGDFAMQERLVAVLEDLIEKAAMVCERRAACRQDQIVIHNEAMKCADQIRHNFSLRQPT